MPGRGLVAGSKKSDHGRSIIDKSGRPTSGSKWATNGRLKSTNHWSIIIGRPKSTVIQHFTSFYTTLVAWSVDFFLFSNFWNHDPTGWVYVKILLQNLYYIAYSLQCMLVQRYSTVARTSSSIFHRNQPLFMLNANLIVAPVSITFSTTSSAGMTRWRAGTLVATSWQRSLRRLSRRLSAFKIAMGPHSAGACQSVSYSRLNESVTSVKFDDSSNVPAVVQRSQNFRGRFASYMDHVMQTLRLSFQSLESCPKELYINFVLKFFESYSYFAISQILVIYLHTGKKPVIVILLWSSLPMRMTEFVQDVIRSTIISSKTMAQLEPLHGIPCDKKKLKLQDRYQP